ncbi:hypothetical protein C8J55DRAFT_479485 [Lentinula edodes]|uniref:Protein kinase domain-containing protein n=1 Tax=Lentinula lateritia TaxID=40482 RepID=A0A9W8ZY33_9AGAR|nr:hypothetical protein C8J55DRAFT_479485 [Lentinula edodes]
MTTTPPASKELNYMFAHIEDDKLVKDPVNPKFDYGGPGDYFDSFIAPIRKQRPQIHRKWVLLVPETPIIYAPSATLWDRVAECPPVEYYAGYWRLWETGPLPAPVPPIDPVSISVLLVPRSQYAQLNEKRDKLTDLRVKNILQRPQKAPSNGATASTFINDHRSNPIAIGRPKQDDFYHVPISLFHAEFAQFREDIVSGALDQELSPLAYRWLKELSGFFEDEKKRESKFNELLSDLLDGYKVVKKKIGSFESGGGIDPKDLDFPDLVVKPLLVEVKIEFTQGSCDAVFEIVLCDQEGVRLILSNDQYKGDWRKTRIPSVLVIHNGPNIQALGAVYLTDQYVEVLSPSLPLYFSEYDTHSMENLLRFMTALRNLFRSLLKVYEKPNDYAIDSDQVSFPYPRSYRSSGTTVQFTYIKRVSQIRLVFTARTEGDQDIIVKFGYGPYGVEAHQAAAESGFAPALLNHSNLAGGWWMVVMENLESDFQPCDDFDILEPLCKDAITECVSKFHTMGFVHGDLRDTNVFVRRKQDRWQCQLIDYDWAGREGKVVYPIGVYNTRSVWRPELHLGGQMITSEHDNSTVNEFLRRRTKIIRF